jgi:hypothetical protein
MKKTPSIIILIIVFVLLSAGFFYAGMKYGSSKLAAGAQRFQQMGLKGAANTQNKGGLIMGEITAKDEKSMTVKLNTGSSKIIFLSTSTQINKAAAGTIDDLQIGSSVSVSGTSNQDGSLTAQSIQLRPAGTDNPTGTPPNNPIQ